MQDCRRSRRGDSGKEYLLEDNDIVLRGTPLRLADTGQCTARSYKGDTLDNEVQIFVDPRQAMPLFARVPCCHGNQGMYMCRTSGLFISLSLDNICSQHHHPTSSLEDGCTKDHPYALEEDFTALTKLVFSNRNGCAHRGWLQIRSIWV